MFLGCLVVCYHQVHNVPIHRKFRKVPNQISRATSVEEKITAADFIVNF